MLTHLLRRLKHDAKEELYAPLSHSIEEHTDQATRNTMWFYLREALRGDQEAQYQIGRSYLNGELGLDRSFSHAEKWLDQAAHQGHIAAKHELEKAYNSLVFS
ncbi:hypothetical protein ACK2M2_00535 [Acinetobacter sp. TY1]|uniref:hypothetical protein n=1 Tax=unclassified Acinetobacter TaxID=196816 RepID=UPI003917B428